MWIKGLDKSIVAGLYYSHVDFDGQNYNHDDCDHVQSVREICLIRNSHRAGRRLPRRGRYFCLRQTKKEFFMTQINYDPVPWLAVSPTASPLEKYCGRCKKSWEIGYHGEVLYCNPIYTQHPQPVRFIFCPACSRIIGRKMLYIFYCQSCRRWWGATAEHQIMGYAVQNIEYIHYPPDNKIIGNAKCGLCPDTESEGEELGYLL